MAEVTVLGVGRMGGAMAGRLLAAGHQVTVWNRTRAAADALAARAGGPRLLMAVDPARAVAGARFVICALADGDVTCSVLLDDSVLAALRDDAVVCDMGTSGVRAARVLAAALAGSGHEFVDAPVSGSVATVEAGQLLVMAAGNRAAVEAVTPVLSAFAKRVAFLGPTGNGQAMKLAVNTVVHDLNAALSEALALASRAGIQPADAYDVFQASVVAAPYVNYKRDAFLDPRTPVAMSLDLVAKDLRLISAFAEDLGISLPATQAVAREVSAACAAGLGTRDMASLSRFVGS